MIEPLKSLRSIDTKYLGAFAILLAAVTFAYWPGLAGPFLFDDFGSISELGALGGVSDWQTFKAFIFGGFTGPTGRPVALLSFLIDGNNWPTEPLPFKRTNLLIHLLNGVLLGILTLQILKLTDVQSQHAKWLALLSAGCWLLHPFLVSTTLYVVQRMAQLATTFVFLGLITYLHGRGRLTANRVSAYVTMSLGLGVFTTLAVLSKENGALLPLLAGVLEITVLARAGTVSLNRYWAAIFLVIPTLFIAAYLGSRLFRDDFFELVAPRDYSIYERLLTQSRVLVDYLHHWFMPRLYTTGLFQDHFGKSSGILAPVTTLVSIIFNCLLITLAVVKRKAWPLFAMAILFFYTSHLLESTVLNLELYFEHRNYLAAAFLLLPLLVLLRQRTSNTVFFAVAFTALFALGSFTRYSATIWSDYPRMVEASARKAPTSMRAQQQYAVNLFNDGLFDDAINVLDRAVANVPDDAGIHVARATVLCSGGRLTREDFDDMTKFVAAKRYDIRALQLYSSLTDAVINGNCPDVSAIQLRQLFEAMLTLPDNADPVQARFAQIKFLAGVTEIALGEPELATVAFEESLVSRPGAGRAMRMASLLATAGYYMDALALSAIALQDLEVAGSDLFSGTRVRKSDIEEFRTQLRTEIDRAATAPKPDCGDDWYALVESKLPTGDGAGHGPDPGSDEWRSVVEFRLGIRGDAAVPDRSTPDWCEYIDTQLEGLN